MREGLEYRLKLINDVSNIRSNLLQEMKPPPQGSALTKGHEAAQLLKQALQFLGEKLTDPEPSAVVLDEAQWRSALYKTGEVMSRARKLLDALRQFRAAKLADYAGNEILPWTDEEKAALQQHLLDAGQELINAIEAL